MTPGLLRQIMALADNMGGDEVFDPGVALRYMNAVHGLLICMREVHPEAAMSGQECLERAEELIAEHFKKLGIQTEKCFTEDS